MSISYRTRQRCKRLFTTVGVLLAIAVFVWLCWLLWLDRYIVYQRGSGAKLDFDLAPLTGEGEHLSGTVKPTVPLQIYNPKDPNTPSVDTTQKPISGYHIDFETLKKDMDAVKAQVDLLSAGTAVLVDVKHPMGYFYYSSAFGNTYESQIDPLVFDSFLDYLNSRDLYLIARLPAFQDRYFGLNHIAHGIPFKGGGGALFQDSEKCYWLRPNSEVVQQNLIGITKELRNLGFDEVVFTDFCLPDDDSIVFNSDPVAAITEAAQLLVDTCATESFWVSFTGSSAFPLPTGNARLYLENVAAADVQFVVEQVGSEDPSKHILFYATGHDTRFDEYCVLRPLNMAQ